MRAGVGLSVVVRRVGFASGKNCPDDARVLGGKCDDGFFVAAPRDERLGPGAESIGALGEHAERGTCPMHEQRSEVDITAFGDASEARFASGGVLPWDE